MAFVGPLLPAGAGVIPSVVFQRPITLPSPRRRGGDPISVNDTPKNLHFSPQARG